MENEEKQVAETEEAIGGEETKPEEKPEGEESKESEDYRAKLNIQNRILEKEGYEFKDGKWIKNKKVENQKENREEGGLTPEDAIVLGKSNIHEDDVNEVIEYARFKKIKIRDAVKDPTLKAILDRRVEERTTAAAANTKGGQRGTSKKSPESLLAEARRGNMPESDEDIEALVKARFPKAS